MRLLARRAKLGEDAATLLAELGSNAFEVAVSLRAVGVGPAEWHGDCPLSRFLYAVVGSDPRVKGIRLTGKWVVLHTRLRCGSRVWVGLPTPVRDFWLASQAALAEEETAEKQFGQDNRG